MAWEREHDRHGRSAEQKRLRKWALANLEYVCAVPGCNIRQGLHLDHVYNVRAGGAHSQANVQWLCPPHHKPKIQAEAKAGRERHKRKPLRHPGLM